MIRSFDYVTNVALARQFELGTLREEQLGELQPWATFWCGWVSAVFLKVYLKVVAPAKLVPSIKEQLATLFEAHLLEKQLSELAYELRHRPDWVKIPLRGLGGRL